MSSLSIRGILVSSDIVDDILKSSCMGELDSKLSTDILHERDLFVNCSTLGEPLQLQSSHSVDLRNQSLARPWAVLILQISLKGSGLQAVR